MLRTKCIFSPVSEEDGLRISIMSRHTLNDGVTPDQRFIEGVTCNEHWRALAPEPKQVGKWYRGLADLKERGLTDQEMEKERAELWRAFAERYLQCLDRPTSRMAVEYLAVLARDGDVTVLCAEETQNHCHRGILAEVMLRRHPEVEIRHV